MAIPTLEEQIRKRQAYARKLGWSEEDVLKATEFERTRGRRVAMARPEPEVAAPTALTRISAQPATITGYTLEEHTKALRRAREAGDTAAIKIINEDYDREWNYQKEYGTTKKQREADVFKESVADQARSIQQVINAKDQFTEKEYRDTINSLSSEFYLRLKKAGELGTALTPGEIAILAGQAPVVKFYGPSIPSKARQAITGELPVQRGEVLDDEATLLNKTSIIIAGMTGQPIGPEIFEKGRELTEKGLKLEEEKINVNIVENALNEVVGFATAIPNLARLTVDLSPPGQLLRYLQGRDVAEENRELAKTFFGGLLDDLGKTTGISIDEENQVEFDPKGALVHDWNHPLGTLAYVFAFMKVAKLAKGARAARAVAPFPKITPPAPPGAPPTLPVEISPIRGRLLTGVAAPVSESITKSEVLMKDALQITRSITRRGVAKELEAFIPKTGRNIDSYAGKLDKLIGPQSMEQNLAFVMEKVGGSSVAQTAPDLVTKLESLLRSELAIGELPGGLLRGEVFATNVAKINETRKFLNKGISKNWFKNGQPTVSATEQLNALKWEASTALKDIMIEADKSGGYFQKAINLQHSAFSTSPVLSAAELGGRVTYGVRGAIAGYARGAVEPFRVVAGRMAAGRPGELVRAITEGRVPEVPAPTAPVAPGAIPTTPVMGGTAIGAPAVFPRRPLEPQIIEKMLKGKGPAQRRRIMRDLRFKQGEWQPRKTQERILREASKRKYK